MDFSRLSIDGNDALAIALPLQVPRDEALGGDASLPIPSASSDTEAPPIHRSSVDGIDENLLLAETEAILATLDATAFASSRATRAVKMRAPTRDKIKEELALLRKAGMKLEAQLTELQRKNHSVMAVRSAREQIWRKITKRQFCMRQLADADNAQLKAMMVECLKSGDTNNFACAFGVKRTLLELPNYAHGPLKQSLGVPHDMALSSAFEPLLRRLDAGYAEMDVIFCENGMDQGLLHPRSYVTKKNRRLGDAHQYLELVDMRLTPFDADIFAGITWRCNKDWHLKDSPYVYPCAKSSNDTFAVNYRMKSSAFEENESVNYYLVMRIYRDAGRYVMMLATQCDGEMELSGASSNEISWLVVIDASLLSNDEEQRTIGSLVQSPSLTAVIQSCLHITLTGGDLVGEAKLTRLASRLMAAFEEDVVYIRQNVDSLLLQESRARSDQRAKTSS